MYEQKVDYETKAKLHLGVSGSIVKWNQERGFGFIKTAEVADEIFFHANTLVAKDERAPQKNESVTIYAKYDDEKKRWTATKVTSPPREQLAAARQTEEHTLIRPMKDKLQWAVPVAVLWLVVVAYASGLLGLSYVVISLIALCLYAMDKRRALDDANSRIPENSLHVVALLGGWAGALLARYLFRHKTQKQPFVNIFWLTVALNIALTAYFIFSGSLKNLAQ